MMCPSSRWYPVIKEKLTCTLVFLLNHVQLFWSHDGVLFYSCTISLLLYKYHNNDNCHANFIEHFSYQVKKAHFKGIWHTLYIVLPAQVLRISPYAYTSLFAVYIEREREQTSLWYSSFPLTCWRKRRSQHDIVMYRHSIVIAKKRHWTAFITCWSVICA